MRDLKPSEIDFRKVTDHIEQMLPGVPVTSGHSGGGCATIYLGAPWFLNIDGKITETDEGGDWLYPVMGGPGWMGEYGYWGGIGDVEDFTIGYDGNEPDPAVANVIVDFTDDGHDERLIAQAMVNLYRKHPRLTS